MSNIISIADTKDIHHIFNGFESIHLGASGGAALGKGD